MKQPSKKLKVGGSLSDIHTGTMKDHPGVLKAKKDKAKADSVVKSYKKSSDVLKNKAIVSAKNKTKR